METRDKLAVLVALERKGSWGMRELQAKLAHLEKGEATEDEGHWAPPVFVGPEETRVILAHKVTKDGKDHSDCPETRVRVVRLDPRGTEETKDPWDLRAPKDPLEPSDCLETLA